MYSDTLSIESIFGYFFESNNLKDTNPINKKSLRVRPKTFLYKKLDKKNYCFTNLTTDDLESVLIVSMYSPACKILFVFF